MKKLLSLIIVLTIIFPTAVLAKTEQNDDIYGWKIEYRYDNSELGAKMSHFLSDSSSLAYDGHKTFSSGKYGLALSYQHPDWTDNTYIAAKTVIPASELKSDSSYRLSFWVNRRLCAGYEFSIDGAKESDSIVKPHYNSDWSELFTAADGENVVLDFKTGSSTADITIKFIMYSGYGEWGGGFMYIDDVSAKLLSDGEMTGDELITNGGFDVIPTISEVSSDYYNGNVAVTWTNPNGAEKTLIEKYDENGSFVKSEETEKESYFDSVEKYSGYTYKLSSVFPADSPYYGAEQSVRTIKINAGDDDSVAGWNINKGSNKPKGFDYAWVKLSDDAYEGEKSVQILYKAKYAPFTYCNVYRNISVEPNTSYILSVYSKANGITNANLKINDVLRSNLNTSNSWQQTKYEFTTGSSENSIGIIFAVEESESADSVGTLWLDNVRLEKKSGGNNLISNGGFEGKTEDNAEEESAAGEISESLGEWTHYIKHNKMKLSNLKCRARISDGLYLSNNIAYSSKYYSGASIDVGKYLSANKNYTCRVKFKGRNIQYAGFYIDGKSKKIIKSASEDTDEIEFDFSGGNEILFDVRLNGFKNDAAELWIESIDFYNEDGSLAESIDLSSESVGMTQTTVNASKLGSNVLITAEVENKNGDYEMSIEPVLGVYEENRLVGLKYAETVIKHGESKQYSYIVPYEENRFAKLMIFGGLSDMESTENVNSIDFSALSEKTITAVSDSDFDEIISAMTDNIRELISKCDVRNIPCKNEKSAMYVMERFCGYGKDDIANGMTERAAYVRDTLMSIYSETKTNLDGYLSGTKKPFESAEYVSSITTAENRCEYAKSSTGEEKRPTYFLGMGHYAESINDMEFFSDIGLNLLSPEIYMYDVMKNGKEVYVDYGYIDYIKSVLDKARKENMKVHLLINVTGLPSWVRTKYPDSYSDNGYNYNNSDVQKLIKRYIRVVMTSLSGYEDTIHSICLMNEPCVRAGNYDIGKFRTWLEQRYSGDIGKLNSSYGTSYASFSEIPMTAANYTSPSSSMTNLNKYYDYIEFNDENFAEFNQIIFNECKKYAPDFKFQIKVQNQFNEYEMDYYASKESKFLRGTDPELLAEIYDLNGCDGEAYLGAAQSIRSKFEYYDFLTSVNDLPVVNGEDHIYFDGDTDFGKKKVLNAVCDAWQGAMHGRSATAIWLWGRSYDSSSIYYGSVAARPDYVYGLAKTCNDLNRLAYEVESFNKADTQAAVYFDKNLVLKSRAAMGITTRVYEALWDCGLKTGFVTDRTIENLDNYKILVLPETIYINESTLSKINDFVSNGGKLYIVSTQTPLKYDEHGNALDAGIVSSVKAKAEIISASARNGIVTSPSLDTLTDRFMQSAENMSSVTIRDKSGNYIKDVEYQSVEYNGKTIVSVCNYDIDNLRELVFYINGQRYDGNITDLRKGEIQTGAYVLKSYEPTILRLEN